MVTTIAKQLTLEEFLRSPEPKPASEYIDRQITQKPMPKGKHSCLRYELCHSINQSAEPQKIAYAFPELRCTFADRRNSTTRTQRSNSCQNCMVRSRHSRKQNNSKTTLSPCNLSNCCLEKTTQ